MLNDLKKYLPVSFAIIVSILVILAFLYVWPGPYRYQYHFHRMGLIRIDKLTGQVGVASGDHYLAVTDINAESISFDTGIRLK